MPGPLTRALFQLLTVNPKHRVSSLQDMRAAPALAGVLWAELSEKKVEPGFVPNVSPWAWGGQGGRGQPGTSSAPSSTERPPALRPHLRAGGDDPGVAAAAQEEEASGQEQVPGQQQGQLPIGECGPAPGRLCSGPSPLPLWWGTEAPACPTLEGHMVPGSASMVSGSFPCVCVHSCVCTRVYVCVPVFECTCVFACVHSRVYMCMCARVREYTHVFVCIRACVCPCVPVSVHVCVCTCVCACVHM